MVSGWTNLPPLPGWEPSSRFLSSHFSFLNSVLQCHQATKAKNEELLTAIAETFPEGSAMKRLLKQGEALEDIAVQVAGSSPSQNWLCAGEVWWGGERSAPCLPRGHLQLRPPHGRRNHWHAHLVPATPGGGKCGQVCVTVGIISMIYWYYQKDNDDFAWNVQAPGSVYFSSPTAFTHAVGHPDLDRCKSWRILISAWGEGGGLGGEIGHTFSVLPTYNFRDSRIVAVQCRVSEQKTMSQIPTPDIFLRLGWLLMITKHSSPRKSLCPWSWKTCLLWCR